MRIGRWLGIGLVVSFLVAAAVVAIPPAVSAAHSPLKPAGGTTPPFTQCPAIDYDPSCALLIVFNHDGSVTVLTDPSVLAAYDDIDDTLIGVQNNYIGTVSSMSISGTDIFAFDGDGLCSGAAPGSTWTPPAGCPFGPTGYEGPGISYSFVGFPSSSATTGTVSFAGGLAPGGSTYFSLESTVSAATITVSITGKATLDTLEPAWSSGNLCSPASLGSISYPASGDITCVSLISNAGYPLWWNFSEVPAEFQGGTVTVDIYGSADCINLNFHSFFTAITVNLLGSDYSCGVSVTGTGGGPGVNIVLNSEGDSFFLNQLGSFYTTNMTIYGTTSFVSVTQDGSFDATTLTYIGFASDSPAQTCPSGITDGRVAWSEVSFGSYNTFNTIFVDGNNVAHPPANYAYSTEPLLPPDGSAFGTSDLYGNETTQTAPAGSCAYLGT